MLLGSSPHLPNDINELTGHQTPRVASKRTCSIHKGGHCCLASPQFRDFIAGYIPGSPFVDRPEQQDSSPCSAEPASAIDTVSVFTCGSALDVSTTISRTDRAGASPAVAPMVVESVSSSSSEGTMRTNLTTPERSTKPVSMVARRSTDTTFSSGLPPTNHSAPSLIPTQTSIFSYSPTPVSTLASASHSLHDLSSSSSMAAAAAAFANLTPKARRRTLDTFAADQNVTRRDWKAIHPPYKPESRLGSSAGDIRRASTTTNGMSSYGVGNADTTRWNKLLEATKNEDNARDRLKSALNNQGTQHTPGRRKMVQIYEPIKSSPLVPKPSSPPSPPMKDSKQDMTVVLPSPTSSISPVLLSRTASLSTITTQNQNQTPPSILVSFVETGFTPATQSPSLPPSTPTTTTVFPEQPRQEDAGAVKSSALPPPASVPALPAQTPQTTSVSPTPSSPLATPPRQMSSQVIQMASTSTEVIPASASPPLPVAVPSATTLPELPATTLPTPTNHVHLSRRTYLPPSKRPSFLSRFLFSFSPSHPNSSTSSHSSSIYQPPTFTSTKHPPSSTSSTGGGGLGRDITGTFVIDPLLVLPKGLFRMFSDDMFLGLSSTPTPSSELLGRGCGSGLSKSGDSDVDIRGGLRLKRSQSFGGQNTPTSVLNQSGLGALNRHYRHGRTDRQGAAELIERGEKKKNLRLEVENGGMDIDVYIIPTIHTNVIGSRRKRIQQMEQRKRTTIELTLLSATINGYDRGRGRRGQQLSKFDLTAKIHAKGPRQPLHITARTYTPPHLPSPFANEMTLTAPLDVPLPPPNPKTVAEQSSLPAVLQLSPPLSPPPPLPAVLQLPPPLSPPPPPSPSLMPPSPPLSPPSHSSTSPLPLSATTASLLTVHSDYPPSPTSSSYTTNTIQTVHTARTTNTNFTASTLATTEMTKNTDRGLNRSGSTGRKLHRKRPLHRPKRTSTLTPYCYATAEEAVAAMTGGAEGENVDDAGGGIGGCIGAGGGREIVRGQSGDLQETSAPPYYTQTHQSLESPLEATNRFPSDPYDAVHPPDSEPPRASPKKPSVPVAIQIPASSALPEDDKTSKKSNSEKHQRKPPLQELDNSDLTLSLPRTFHGPLSIHVQAGNLDEHIELSEALQKDCVLVREGGCARGLFVGDFRKEFGFDWGGGASADETSADSADGEGEKKVECICGEREVGKAEVNVGGGEERRVKRRPAVEFSTTAKSMANAIFHSDSEESNPTYTTPQTTTLHTRAKSDSRSSSPIATTANHVRSQSALPVLASAPSSGRPYRPSFLDIDPETLVHKTNNGGNNGQGQIGWRTTKVQNTSGRVRVPSEHQSIIKVPPRDGQAQTPAWVLPRSELPGTVKRSTMLEGGDEDTQVRRLLPEGRVGYENDGFPARVDDNGVDGGGLEDDLSGGGVEDIRKRNANAPVAPARIRGENWKCTCGASKIVGHSTNAGSRMKSSAVDTRKGSEWMGDRIDISIGKGKVRLLYDDENVDVFRPMEHHSAAGVVKKEKKRWWKFGKGD